MLLVECAFVIIIKDLHPQKNIFIKLYINLCLRKLQKASHIVLYNFGSYFLIQILYLNTKVIITVN